MISTHVLALADSWVRKLGKQAGVQQAPHLTWVTSSCISKKGGSSSRGE